MHMETNAGYPPKYTETDSAQYSDFEKKMTRLDVKEASYGAKDHTPRSITTMNCFLITVVNNTLMFKHHVVTWFKVPHVVMLI